MKMNRGEPKDLQDLKLIDQIFFNNLCFIFVVDTPS